MTLPLIRRRRVAAPVLVSLTNHWTVCADGELRRDCLIQMPDGATVLRPVSDARLAALGVAA